MSRSGAAVASRPEQGFSILSRSDAHVALEGPGEVTLIGESGRQGDLTQRGIRGHQFPTSEFQAQVPDIRSHGAVEILVKHLR